MNGDQASRIEEAWAWQPAGWGPPSGPQASAMGLPQGQRNMVSVATHGAMTVASTSSVQTWAGIISELKGQQKCLCQSQHMTAEESGGSEKRNSCPRIYRKAVTKWNHNPGFNTWAMAFWHKVCLLKKGDGNEIEIMLGLLCYHMKKSFSYLLENQRTEGRTAAAVTARAIRLW